MVDLDKTKRDQSSLCPCLQRSSLSLSLPHPLSLIVSLCVPLSAWKARGRSRGQKSMCVFLRGTLTCLQVANEPEDKKATQTRMILLSEHTFQQSDEVHHHKYIFFLLSTSHILKDILSMNHTICEVTTSDIETKLASVFSFVGTMR